MEGQIQLEADQYIPYPLEEIKPLLLSYLLMRSQVLRTLTKLIYELYGTKKDIKVLGQKLNIQESLKGPSLHTLLIYVC